MLVELHIIQNFAPSNLNRDDTGAPKDCEFGGVRRARISSQCLKRAVRTAFGNLDLVPAEQRGRRTKRLRDELAERLAAAGKPRELAQAVAEAAITSAGLSVDKDGLTQYLLFLGEREIAMAAEVCLQHWDALSEGAQVGQPAEGARPQGREAKRTARAALPDVRRAIEALLTGGKAADVALFGRMLADLPDRNIDAASQVAHAISTHQVSMEFDYFTAVDDLNPREETGAGMIGTVEFNSACYYRYANVDLGQLQKNLDGDVELARQTLEAFLRASVAAIPTGKQNSMAAQNPPSLVMSVVREAGTWSLANAFARPVRPRGEDDLITASVRALDAYWSRLAGMYGLEESGITKVYVSTTEDAALESLKDRRVPNVPELIKATVTAVYGNGSAA